MIPENGQSDLPATWVLARMDAIGAVRVGRQRTPDQVSGRHDTPYLRAGNISEDGLDLSEVFEMDFTEDEREIYALRSGDVVLAEASGSASHVGRPALWHGELPLCCFQNTVIRFRPHAAHPDYALAVFRHYVAAGIFAGAARGIGLLHLGARRFASLPFPLPPMLEQKRIAAALDFKLRELRQARDALQSALRGTYKQDTEILAAAATGTLVASEADPPPRSAPVDGLVARSPIPTAWRWSTIAEVGELRIGKTLGGSRRGGQHRRPYLRVANVLEDHIDFTDLKETEFTEEELARFALRAGDILINDGQSLELVGRPAIYRGELAELYHQNHLIRFRPHEHVLAGFALLVFRHYLHAGEFRRIARGSTNIANLSQTRLGEMPFPVPPLHVQETICTDAAARLAASADQRQAIVSSLANGEAMAVELLKAAVSGRLVEQDPADEPAADLLARLGPTPARQPRARRLSATRGAARPAASTGNLDLVGALTSAARPLRLPDLCRAAGVDINSVDAIEQLYTELRSVVGGSVRIVGGAGEEAELEVDNHAAR